ncbi:GerMN domain-containing protein [Thalassobacillus sp. C254]|uniref:GerMN domain-containing protein n=1 Tax=Thalassobacillus sp. C254 TaxID=1225341 RepID=UPI0006D08CF5|nr:GerMN domain-containing protein [Thalassobacillus sp. C254]
MKRAIIKGVSGAAVLGLLLSGCGFGNNEAGQEMDSPQIDYIDEGTDLEMEAGNEVDGTSEEEGAESEEGSAEISEETVDREIYLLDEDGMVVPQTLSLPKEEGALRQALEYLVIDGPVTQMIPNGFQAVLPPGTEIDVHLTEDGTAVADFSPEFEEYPADKELSILQSITWTLTQFENVEEVQIRINGYDQEVMPVNETPIGDGLSRSNGINLETGNASDLTQSESVSVYFLSQKGEEVYYVPVTRRVDREKDQMESVVEELLEGPEHESSLLSDFRNGVELTEEPTVEAGVVSLTFNDQILSELEGTAISNHVLNTLALSFTELEGIEEVAVSVEGTDEVLTTSGEVLAEPVSRPAQVNTGEF